jgi:hypothetical protein
MNRYQLKIATASFLPAVATMLFVQACGGGGDAAAQTSGEPIEGVWEAVVSQRDCATNAVVGTFRSTQMLHRGGTVTDTNAGPPTLRGPGFGVWSRGTGDNYTAKVRFNRHNADGSLAGSQVITRAIVLTADGNTFNSTNQATVLDVAGATVTQICATEVATRFR